MNAPESSFTGFMGEIEEENNATDLTDWLLHTADHTFLAGGFEKVRIFLTGSSFGAPHKWNETRMHGVLRLVQIKEIEGFPVVMVQLTGVD